VYRRRACCGATRATAAAVRGGNYLFRDRRGAGAALLVVRDGKLVTVVACGHRRTFLALAVAGWLLVKALTPLRRGVGVAWRYGLANIARRGRDSVVQIVAFGLG